MYCHYDGRLAKNYTTGEVFNLGTSGGGTSGGGTSGGGESWTGPGTPAGNTPDEYSPSLGGAPSGYQDISCANGSSNPNWTCAVSSGNQSKNNPYSCGWFGNINDAWYESDIDQSKLCRNGTKMQMNINRATNIITWYCANESTKESVRCAGKIKVDGACGTAAGKPAPYDYNDRIKIFTATNPALCSKGGYIKTYKYNGGTQFEPYYDYLIESDKSLPETDPMYPSTFSYIYTC
jgi:hypothetical protein